MADKQITNYPDMLGYITDDVRVNIGVIQTAMVLRPRVIRAGRPFEVILLIQNASDIEIDVAATLKLPDQDAKKQKGCFIAKNPHLRIGMGAAEVGYLSLPVTTLPNTAVGQGYELSLDVRVEPVGKKKPQRIRLPEGGAEVSLDNLPEETLEHIEDLKKLTFSAEKSGGLRSTGLQATFSVMSGKVGKIADLQPGWTSLWTLKDYLDDRLLLTRYRDLIKEKVLAQLDRNQAFKPILQENQKRFKQAGFELKPHEALFMAKLLTLILEYSSPTYGTGTQIAAGMYNIQPLLDKKTHDDEINLPRWCSRYLRILHQDQRVADHAIQAILHFGYEDLLADAMLRAFEMIEISTGEDIGSIKERQIYVEQTLDLLRNGSMDFSHVYMPLLLGGIIAYDSVMLEGEKLGNLLQEMRTIIDQRSEYRNESTEPIFAMAATLVDQALFKYGYRNK